MKLHVLGTGNGSALKCFNTCFCIENQGQYFLVDGGGGNQISLQLQKANIKEKDIHDIFVSHNHLDHITGVKWVLRNVSYKNAGDYRVYGSDVTIKNLKNSFDEECGEYSRNNNLDQIKLITVSDGEMRQIVGMNLTFFDIQAEDKQFGFSVNDNTIVFSGDEPLKESLLPKFPNSKWLLHEASCVASGLDAEGMEKLYKDGHCTVKDAACNAAALNCQNLLMWHTRDANLATRKCDFTREAQQYYKGNIFVPDDLEVININTKLREVAQGTVR